MFMPSEEKNFDTGISLPRATPDWSGTMHSMSEVLRARIHARASSTLVTPR